MTDAAQRTTDPLDDAITALEAATTDALRTRATRDAIIDLLRLAREYGSLPQGQGSRFTDTANRLALAITDAAHADAPLSDAPPADTVSRADLREGYVRSRVDRGVAGGDARERAEGVFDRSMRVIVAASLRDHDLSLGSDDEIDACARVLDAEAWGEADALLGGEDPACALDAAVLVGASRRTAAEVLAVLRSLRLSEGHRVSAGQGGRPPILDMADAAAARPGLNRLAAGLMRTWGEVQPRSGVAQHPAAYVATFVDLGRSVLTSSWLVEHERGVRVDAVRVATEWASPRREGRVPEDRLAELEGLHWKHPGYGFPALVAEIRAARAREAEGGGSVSE